MADAKPKHSPSLRTPKAKKKLGLSVPPALKMPHDDLIQHQVELANTLPSQTSHTSSVENIGTSGNEI